MGRINIWILFCGLLLVSCGAGRLEVSTLEPIVHEKKDLKAPGEVTSRELKIIHGKLKKLEHQLSGENDDFNESLEQTEEALSEIPRQLEEAAGGLQKLLDQLSQNSEP